MQNNQELRRAGWLAGLLVLVLGLQANTQAADPVASVRVIHAKTREPLVPFHVDRSPESQRKIAAVRLFQSLDGGQKWNVIDTRTPAETAFQPKFPSDGEYWLAIRTIDRSGGMHPGGALQPDLKIFVDTAPPFLKVQLEREPSGEILAKIRVSDARLDGNNVNIQARFRSPQGEWIARPADSLDSLKEEAGLKLAARWRKSSAVHVVMQVQAKDKAGNLVVKEAAWTSDPAQRILLTQAETPGESIFPIPAPTASPKLIPVLPRQQNPGPVLQFPALPKPVPQPSPVENQAVPPLPMGVPLDVARSEILLRAARNAVKLGNRTEALARFEELLQLDPSQQQARSEYAGLLMQDQRLKEAQTQLNLLVDQDPDRVAYRTALADLLIQQGDYELARIQLLWLVNLPEERTAAAVKLAKTFAWEKRNAEAVEVYDTYLKSLTRLNPADQRELARLLMTMNRTADAVELLLPLSKRPSESDYDAPPFDETVVRDLVLAYTRMMQRTAAIQTVLEMRSYPMAHPDAWLELGGQLYQEQAFVEALAVFDLIPKDSIAFPKAKLGAARSHLRLYETTLARQILDEMKSVFPPEDASYSTVEADYHTVVGDWARAISIAQQRLRKDPLDREAMILLGNAYRASQQFLKAQATFAKAVSLCGENLQHREEVELLAAQTLMDRRLFKQAAIAFEQLLMQRPENIAARLLLVQTLRKSKRFAEAERLARPGPNDIDPRHRFALRIELGYVLLDNRRLADASREFESLLDWTDGITPDVAYGLYRAQSSLNHLQAARGALLLGPTQTAPPGQWAIVVSGRALGDCDCPLAEEVLDQYLGIDPQNLAALNMRGEAAHQCDHGCCNPKDKTGCEIGACESGNCQQNHCNTNCGSRAVSYFQRALDLSPQNLRARLGLARSLVKHHQFALAAAEYVQLLDYQPNNINIRRELGRLLDGWKGLEDAEEFYASGFEFTEPGAALFGPAGSWNGGGGGTGFGSGFGAGTGGGEIRLLSGTTFDEETHTRANELMTTEYQAKYFRGWRNRLAIPLYEGLITQEPTNEEGYFDLGQVYAGMNHTRCAIHTYERLLEVNPCHAQAWQAYQRLQLELRPQVRAGFDFVNKDGRDGLADIRWARPTIAGHFPLGDAEEFVQFGYRHMILRPTDDVINHSEVGFVRLQEKLNKDWLLFGEVDLEEFDYGLKTRPTFEAGTQYTFGNDAVLRGIGFLNNVIENGESIRQDIYRAGFQMEGSWQPLRRWEVNGFYRWADYSDSNTLNEMAVNGAYQILRGRKQLRGLVDVNLITFAEQSRLPNNPGSLVGTVHPYFAPSGFSFASMGLEWKHWLSCDNFQGADQWWYRVYLGSRFDSQSEAYFLFKGEMLYDIRSWLTWSVQTSLIESEVYDEASLSTYGIIRFR